MSVQSVFKLLSVWRGTTNTILDPRREYVPIIDQLIVFSQNRLYLKDLSNSLHEHEVKLDNDKGKKSVGARFSNKKSQLFLYKQFCTNK